MTKAAFLASLSKLYTVGNLSDSDSPQRADWTHPDMAGPMCCALIDTMLSRMVEQSVITREEFQAFHDDMI